jgi:hypothetical protein
MAADNSDPNRKFEPGFLVPIIEQRRCEAKGPCVDICHFDLSALRLAPKNEKVELSLLGASSSLRMVANRLLPSIQMRAADVACARRRALKRRLSCKSAQSKFPQFHAMQTGSRTLPRRAGRLRAMGPLIRVIQSQQKGFCRHVWPRPRSIFLREQLRYQSAIANSVAMVCHCARTSVAVS